MPSTTVNATRMELTRLKKKLKTAVRGHKLLKDKRDELMKQFLDMIRENRALRTRVEEALMRAHGSFTVASALMSTEMLEQALLYPEDFARIRAVGNPVAETVAGWLDFFFAFHRMKGYAGAPVHDAVAVCALLRPDLLHFEDWHVTVETQGAFCRGATVGDRRTAPNARVITGIDREGFAELLTEAVRTYG